MVPGRPQNSGSSEAIRSCVQAVTTGMPSARTAASNVPARCRRARRCRPAAPGARPAPACAALAHGGVERGRHRSQAALAPDRSRAACRGRQARLHVDRDVHPHRAGAATGGDVQRLLQLEAHALRVGQQDGVLGDRLGHAHDLGFLVAELAQPGHRVGGQAGLALDLARDHEHRHRIGPGAEDAVERVDAAGAGGDVDHADAAGDAGIAFRRHRAGLLMVVEHR